MSYRIYRHRVHTPSGLIYRFNTQSKEVECINFSGVYFKSSDIKFEDLKSKEFKPIKRLTVKFLVLNGGYNKDYFKKVK